MVLEAVHLYIRADQSRAFEAAFEQALPLVQSIEGYVSHELQRCIEQDNHYLLLIRWQTLQDHTEGFRLSPQYQQWKQLLHHFYDPFPNVLHFESVLDDVGGKNKSG
ncbi:MAG: antibiotic biosynthesis monooxygenase [Gammaproteobacteria bacterium]|nr:MAG: antibiotic biosynthesis monooxygenase [Gammaproteobacteria bacterium]